MLSRLPRRGEAEWGTDGPRPAGMGEAGGRAPLWGCARGGGIEKALAVRQGIEKVFYSKEMISVRFRCGATVVGNAAPNEPISSADSSVTTASNYSVQKSERLAPEMETSPSLKLERMQNVEHMAWPPTLDIFFANTGHSYWEHFRLTGEYNLRPTL
jgi:hypothetical protein